jgi:N6-L-threonylcarbamoyladenine synthase
VAGGVAANAAVRARLQAVAQAAGLPFLAPPLHYCTDNAAMIAWAAIEQGPGEAAVARPRWPLDSAAPALVGSGRKGAKG